MYWCIYIYIFIHTYRLDSSFIFIHDIYQVVQDFAQQNGKTSCCKIVRQNAEHIYRLVFPGASYSLPYLEGKHYADVFSPLQHWYLIMIDGYVESWIYGRTECGDGSGKISNVQVQLAQVRLFTSQKEQGHWVCGRGMKIFMKLWHQFHVDRCRTFLRGGRDEKKAQTISLSTLHFFVQT